MAPSSSPQRTSRSRALAVLATIPLVVAVAGCPNLERTADTPPSKNGGGGPRGGANYATVQVHYGTDRNYTGAEHPRDKYGPERGDEISWGKCLVSIPRDHRMGELESPSIWRLEFREDPEKHVVLLEGVRTDRDAFLADVRAEIAASPGGRALVFVHGYNVTFEDAARRTAQMSYDLGFAGPPIFFSWPSNGSKAAYAADEADIEWSTPHITDFLRTVADDTAAEAIYLVAHSMGNRGVTRALMQLEPTTRARYREVILTAPDLDADIFRRDILPAIAVEGSRITLYASSNDLALRASKTVHQSPRAGEAGASLVVAPGLDTIDASSVETDFLGHSYYAEHRSVLSDLFYLINEGKPPAERFGLARVDGSGGVYWKFQQ